MVRVSVGYGIEVLPILSADAVLAYERELRRNWYRAMAGRLGWGEREGMGRWGRPGRVRMTRGERALERAADRLLRSAK